MKFGTFCLIPWREGQDVGQLYRQNLEQAQLAEDLGFDAVWMAEHHFSPYGTCSAILTYCSNIAARTSRIRIGTAVVVLPFYNPIIIAEEAATVDQLSGGRLDLGLGRGYQAHEFAGVGIPIDESRGRFNECLEIILQAWTEPAVDFQGKHYTVPPTSVYPKPAQRPHPPLWIASSASPETLEYAAKRGLPIMAGSTVTVETAKRTYGQYHDYLTQYGRTSNGLESMLNRCVYVAESPRDAVDHPEEPMMWVRDIFNRVGTPAKDGVYPKEYQAWQRRVRDLSYDELVKNVAIFGTPEQCVESIRFLEKELGLGYLMCNMAFGGLDHDKVKRSMTLFAREVMPHFR